VRRLELPQVHQRNRIHDQVDDVVLSARLRRVTGLV
jgi:hypothetical protein